MLKPSSWCQQVSARRVHILVPRARGFLVTWLSGSGDENELCRERGFCEFGVLYKTRVYLLLCLN